MELCEGKKNRTFERAMPFICVDEAEVIRLPSFMQLLELPPAKEMPVVAVYKFNDLTGQRKECQTSHHSLQQSRKVAQQWLLMH